jgi:hypothetical protein
MKKLFSLSLALLLASAFVLAAVNVSGDWEMTVKTPQGDRTRPVTFVQDGEKLTVKTTGRDGQEMVSQGTVKGNDIEWTIIRTGQDGTEFKMVYKGKIEGDKMTGTFDMRGQPVEWTAVRKAK